MASEPTARIWEELKSRNEAVRLAAAIDLKKYVSSVMKDLSAEAATKLWDESVSRKLFELVRGTTTAEQLGGLAAIEQLVDIESGETVETQRNLYRFWNYVKILLPNPDNHVMEVAAKTGGKIAAISGASFGESFMQHEVPPAIEHLTSDQHAARYAGALLLNELARNSPTFFHKNIAEVFEKINIPLRDPRVHVREAAAELLASSLDIIILRERQHKSPFFAKLQADASVGLRGTPEQIHGALLTYRALLLHAGMFMRENYPDTADVILKQRGHKDTLVRRTVIMLIPTLAVYDTQSFVETFLHTCMAYLLTQLSKGPDRSEAFQAIGYIATAVGSEIKTFLDPIMREIKIGLQTPKSKKTPDAEKHMFQCIGMLAASVGPNLTKLLHDQLDLMFACGLSEPLHQALVAISRNIPPLLKTIQDRLLEMLSQKLSGQPYKPLGAPPNTLPRQATSVADMITAHVAMNARDPATVALALTILGSFDFTGHILNEFVRTCALPYLEDDHAEVRKAAALTCCRLFIRDPICYQASNHAVEVINEVLGKLLVVGIADPDSTIRQTVLSSLDEKFDKHLAQPEHVRSIFVAVNDEDFCNRVTAIELIGRLAVHNPAYIMPSLRKALIQLMTELQYSPLLRGREESAQLLTQLTSATQSLIKPYALSMLGVLLPKASDPAGAVAVHVLACLGELSCVGGEDFLPHVPQLMEIILGTLADPAAHAKRDAALRTLGQICSNTSYVVQPLVDYPQLLPVLSKILSSEQNQGVRREVIKVLGVLGAIDPYRRKTTRMVEENPLEFHAIRASTIQVAVPLGGAATEEYYQSVVISCLLGILQDPSLSGSHHSAIESIMSIFKTQGLKCVMFLPQIIPAFSAVIRTGTSRFQEFHLQQLAILVGIVKQHIRNHLPEVFSLVHELWDNVTLQLPIVTLIESLAKALDSEFRPFLPSIVPMILTAFDGDLTEKRQATQTHILRSFVAIGSNIEEYLHLVIPVIVKSCEAPDASITLRKTAVQTIDGLSRRLNFSDHVSRIVQPLVRALQTGNTELRTAIMDTLCALVFQLGSDFAIFVPMVNKCLLRNRIVHPKYEQLITKLLNGERLPQEYEQVDIWNDPVSEVANAADPSKMTVNQQHLKQAWDISNVISKEDWLEWHRRVSVEFLKESPSHALRACMNMLNAQIPASKEIAKELFNVSFLSCWTELYENYQENLVSAIETAISHPTVPSEVVMGLLNLAEFMEHQDKPLPIENRILGETAFNFHAYAKALHYKELEFFTDTSPAIMENLININTKLQQHDAALGTLAMARDQFDVSKHEEWFERLGRWQEALDAYTRKAEHDNALDVAMGRMRCLHALGEWEQLARLVDENWIHAGHEDRKEIAPLAAAAAWSLNEWDAMDDYINVMNPESPERSFYRAILSVHRNHFPKALSQITKARDLLDPELTSLVGENYGRSYNVMVRAQMLSELEEIIAYKQSSDQPERQETIRKTWMKRLQGCQPDVEVWQRILQVRALVLSPDEANAMWIKFANLCRKSDRKFLAEKTINSLNSPEQVNGSRAPPAVIYSRLKFLWATSNRADALAYLRKFSMQLAQDLGLDQPDQMPRISQDKATDFQKLLARCYLKQGEWQQQMRPNWAEENYEEILRSFDLATRFDPSWYKAWHTWALANFAVVNEMEANTDHRLDVAPVDALAVRAVAAVEGLLRSISLGRQNSLQDTLRLLTLWFKFGVHDDVSHAIGSGFSLVSVDTWLDVIPQIIARIQTPSMNIRRNITFILNDIGKQHPQALIYPLTVASKSPSQARKAPALEILNRMREHSSLLVEQAMVVSAELIRVAILWHELWYEGLEEASRLYFTEQNPEAMIAALDPLHDMVENGPTTSREISFVHAYGRDLLDAREACRRYRMYGERRDMDRAWDIYFAVFRKIEKQLPQLTTLDLQYVSPELLRARDLVLAVPGTYQSGRPVLRITSFSPKLTVIASKQRPRRLELQGSDGRDYVYALKGHEDLRQDERVMQFFGLVNTLLSVDADSFKRHLHIQRFPVIPLAPNAGLLGWVLDSDTFHVLVRDYRESRKILLNIENRLILQMAPDYECLTLMQKIEVFQHAMDNTTGQDLYRVLWLKSANSEAWIERRTTYTRSLAVSSMVGYVIGLGDRHPSNILFHRATGKVVHIDFGDCFEVAMNRDKFPERVPFRLTRMFIHAMEVSGIHGSFRNTCEISLKVLRDNNESLLAVLEAFVYDPLITWRLLQQDHDAAARQVENPDLAKVAAYGQGPNRKLKADENEIFNDIVGEPGVKQEVRNERALFVYNRVQNKLTGRDFNPDVPLSIPAQVEKLIVQAMSMENLCQHFHGWCSCW